MNHMLKYLRDKEWSMGNGQCPDCCGVSAKWHGHPLHMDAKSIGHEPGCDLAAALADMGVKPLMKGDFTSDAEFEHFISDEGFLGTRPKTENGCERYREWAKSMNE